MAEILTICLVIVGLINFLPVVGIISAPKLESAYAISLQSIELQILMRHRALLFGILGGFILFSAFNPTYQIAAMVMAAVSMIGFAVIVLISEGYNAAIAKVFKIDIVAIVFLAIAAALKYYIEVR
ncbi:hypothetical protein A3742_01280 [Oleiphilus sp. HI0071]|uniref:hypothetical protein n=1 Tax=unclassified Oleiphilus TaxID=2631174 RepID=UPI0007C2E54C|nr:MULTISPECIES: hypothetical protein [unclassified Oleiphilus]KZY59346.1 hypothetical protein A3737_24150 [Oleiphilus sp. HI0065]KZY82008.1 hypothetical protein A3742_01280 [Oleiphilus sp. HI0071]KZY89905.1 hypothetical protein A3744_22445 [Oleiphilus sp. HI0073]KZZ42160.1 hypothetical protein A3758_06180 [Oleiphilus sp. HI0118]KZZ60392.1 hypothetical protein A3760_05890 [Oleiphilus sp. HI0122]KZZ63628.1 hypothetical protein A3765_22110 [Oleiphilus sp. HI0130]KZZ81965.1 hypothetical protein